GRGARRLPRDGRRVLARRKARRRLHARADERREVDVTTPTTRAAELPAPDDALAERTRRRITRRLMPFLICLFVIAFLDRVNVSYAALEMTKDLGFDTEVLGFGAGVFFLG